MEEQMKPGHYTAIENMNIRAAMNAISAAVIGGYRKGVPFTVYEVYPETEGILWGRVSSNTGGGTARYVALRVNNHPKAHMEKALDEEPEKPASIEDWIRGIDAWAREKGYTGPRPF